MKFEYLESVAGQQFQIWQMVHDLVVNFFAVQSLQPLRDMNTKSVPWYYTPFYNKQYTTVSTYRHKLLFVLPEHCLVYPKHFQEGIKQSLHWSPEIQKRI